MRTRNTILFLPGNLRESDLAAAGPGRFRPRVFRVRCGDGELKTIRFQPVTPSDGNQYVTYDEAAGGTPAL